MGMFDFVEYKADCSKCGVALPEFQSKDGECLMETLQPKDVRTFYTSCDKCGTWNQFKVVATDITIERVARDES